MDEDKVEPNRKEIRYIEKNCVDNLNFDHYQEIYMFLGGNIRRVLDFIENQRIEENEIRERMKKLAGLD